MTKAITALPCAHAQAIERKKQKSKRVRNIERCHQFFNTFQPANHGGRKNRTTKANTMTNDTQDTIATVNSLPNTIAKCSIKGARSVSFISKKDFTAAHKLANDSTTNAAHRAFYVELKAHTVALAGLSGSLAADGWQILRVSENANRNRITTVHVRVSDECNKTRLSDEVKQLRAQVASLLAASN